jgi:hypothetical protein
MLTPPPDARFAKFRVVYAMSGTLHAGDYIEFAGSTFLSTMPADGVAPGVGILQDDQTLNLGVVSFNNVDLSNTQGSYLKLRTTAGVASVALDMGGTAFPTSSPDNAIFYRTDYQMWFYWDGSRWLSTTRFDVPIPNTDLLLPFTATNAVHAQRISARTETRWVEYFSLSFYVSGGTALDASNKWVVVLQNDVNSTFATININSGASGVWRTDLVAVAASRSDKAWATLSTKTGTPGDLYVCPPVIYRILAT